MPINSGTLYGVRDSLTFDRDFRRLWVGDAASQLGAMVAQFVLPLLAVQALGATPLQVGLVTAATTLAFLVLGLPAGAWVDRMRRRTVLIVADVARAAVLASLPVAAALGVLTLPQLYVVALGYGALTVFFDVAYQSYLPHLVGRDRLVEGNAKLAATQSVAQMGGPTVGGFLVQIFTAPFAVVAQTLLFAWSAVWIGRIRKAEPRPDVRADRHLGREVAEGLRFVLGHRLLRAIAGCTGSFNLLSMMSQPMLIVLLADRLGLAAGIVGTFFTVGAAGGVAGAVFARRIAARVGQARIIWLSVALAGPFALVVPLAANDWRLWLAAAGQFVVLFGGTVYNVAQVSFRQTATPERLLGRMNATMRFLVWGTMPLGGLLGGGLGTLIGVRPTLWVASAGMALAFLPVFLSPLRGMRELPGVPHAVAEEP